MPVAAAFEVRQVAKAHAGHRGLILLGLAFESTLCRFGFDWKSCRLPGIPASDEGAGLDPTGLSELLRHTGAGGFLRSGAITHDPGIAG